MEKLLASLKGEWEHIKAFWKVFVFTVLCGLCLLVIVIRAYYKETIEAQTQTIAALQARDVAVGVGIQFEEEVFTNSTDPSRLTLKYEPVPASVQMFRVANTLVEPLAGFSVDGNALTLANPQLRHVVNDSFLPQYVSQGTRIRVIYVRKQK